MNKSSKNVNKPDAKSINDETFDLVNLFLKKKGLINKADPRNLAIIDEIVDEMEQSYAAYAEEEKWQAYDSEDVAYDVAASIYAEIEDNYDDSDDLSDAVHELIEDDFLFNKISSADWKSIKNDYGDQVKEKAKEVVLKSRRQFTEDYKEAHEQYIKAYVMSNLEAVIPDIVAYVLPDCTAY